MTPAAKANQRPKVLHCCYDANLTDEPTAWCEDLKEAFRQTCLVVILQI